MHSVSKLTNTWNRSIEMPGKIDEGRNNNLVASYSHPTFNAKHGHITRSPRLMSTRIFILDNFAGLRIAYSNVYD